MSDTPKTAGLDEAALNLVVERYRGYTVVIDEALLRNVVRSYLSALPSVPVGEAQDVLFKARRSLACMNHALAGTRSQFLADDVTERCEAVFAAMSTANLPVGEAVAWSCAEHGTGKAKCCGEAQQVRDDYAEIANPVRDHSATPTLAQSLVAWLEGDSAAWHLTRLLRSLASSHAVLHPAFNETIRKWLAREIKVKASQYYAHPAPLPSAPDQARDDIGVDDGATDGYARTVNRTPSSAEVEAALKWLVEQSGHPFVGEVVKRAETIRSALSRAPVQPPSREAVEAAIEEYGRQCHALGYLHVKRDSDRACQSAKAALLALLSAPVQTNGETTRADEAGPYGYCGCGTPLSRPTCRFCDNDE